MSMFMTRDENGGFVLRVPARFDFGCHADFRRSCTDLSEGTTVTVDMKTTTYLDSAALGMLLLLGEKTGDNQLVRVVNAQGQPAEALRLANFHQLMRIE